MDGVMSTPITRPSGAIFLAAIRLSIPAPEPKSTTLSPGRSSPRLKGLPVPAKDSMEGSGMSSSHSSAYSSMRARGLPVWKWKPFCGSEATSAYSCLIASRRLPTSRAGCSRTLSVMGAPSGSTLIIGLNRDLLLRVLDLLRVFHLFADCSWLRRLSLRLDRVTRRLPLGEPLSEPARPEASGTQDPHRLIGKDAIGASAVGDDLLILR